MNRVMKVYQTENGTVSEIMMSPINARHACKADPDRYSLVKPAPAEDELPALPKKGKGKADDAG